MNRRHYVTLVIVLISMALIAILLLNARRLWDVAHPTYRHVSTAEIAWPAPPTFQNCWQDQAKRIFTSVSWRLPNGGMDHCAAEGTYLPVPNETAMALVVLIPKSEVPPPAPSMRLAITSLIEVSNKQSGPTAVVPQVCGNPPIECNLNSAQAAWVQQHGLPASLIEAMRAAATKAGWKPSNPSEAQYGPTIIIVDPAPFFPPQTPDAGATRPDS